MKRTVAVLFMMAGLVHSALGLRRVTVEQLEQFLAGSRDKPDSELSWLIGDMKLTERLSASRIARLQSMVPGKKSLQVLDALADSSQFQAPPAAEMPATPAPDVAAQQRIMGLVATYVSKAIPQLPNFYATRVTTRFEDTPLLQKPGGFIPYEPLHPVGNSSVTALYRDGREIEDVLTTHTKKQAAQGLTTWGEFGPILATVLLDAAQSKLAWSHWEQGPEGLRAVFTYEVSREKSHYEVNYCCVAEPGAMQANVHPYRQTAGYGGEMAVDPATGTILRLAVKARLKPGSPVVQADILVEYGPVGIGGKIYFCPVKSVSVTTAEMVQVTDLYNQPLALQVQPLKTMLNDVKFEQYHVFRADARVLAADEPAPDSSSPAQVPGAGPSTAGNVLTTPSPALEAEPPAPVVAESPSTATTGPEPAVAEISVTDAAGVPDVPASNRLAAPVSGFTLHTTTRLVDMGLVAYDKKGRPVTDLKQDDFEIYDNGRKQEIRYFAQGGQAAPPPATAASHQPVSPGEIPVYTNRPMREPVTSPLRSSAIEMHATILMIDAANLAWGDLSYAREEMQRFLKTLDATEPVGLYILRSYGFQVLLEPSSDHTLVATRLSRWMPVAQDLARAQDEEQHNRQHIDWVAHTTDLVYVNGNDGTDLEGSASGQGRVALSRHGVDPQLRAMGSNPERDALLGLVTVARHLAVYPGHKSLVWISSDNALADWSGQAAGREDKGSKFIDPLSLRAREALNESHVSLYPLDASQLEASVITADLQNRLIQAKLEEPAQPGASTPPPPPANPTGRNAALMHQDTHAIQGVFRDLAEATGGRALRRAGDIAAELNGIAEDGRAACLLSFTPDSPADDKYHLLSVKLTNRRDLYLRYRTGYLFEKEPATIKERFERAVWQSRDMTEIAINATVTQDSKDRALLLNIAATDLQMADTGDRWTDKLDIFLIERDDAAIHARVTGRTLGLRLRTATYQKVVRDGIPIGQPLPSPPKGGSMRVVVVDENSGHMGSVTIPAITLP